MQDVKKNRSLYIGGSDIPIILGISPFKTRWELLQEKAQILEDEFEGNHYTEYGNIMEEKIRNYINENEEDKFVEGKHIYGNIRIHTDGENKTTILEIKTTSNIKESIEEYNVYLAQLLFYMKCENKSKGKLAIYKRPDNFDEEFDINNLLIYDIDIKDYEYMLFKIDIAVKNFLEDLSKLKENPLLEEEDLIPNELVVVSNEIVALEIQLSKYKEIEKQQKEAKEKLYNLMLKNQVKKWETPNGIKITLVEGKEETSEIVQEFDLEGFKIENEELYNQYIKDVVKTKKGSKGYVKITIPQGDKKDGK